MAFKLLIINPGSTSTKIGVYSGEKEVLVETLRHSAEEIGKFLKERAEICSISFSSNIISSADANEIYRGRAAGVIALIRMGHRLGYELVVRECIKPNENDLKAEKESDEVKKKKLIDDKVKEILGEK